MQSHKFRNVCRRSYKDRRNSFVSIQLFIKFLVWTKIYLRYFKRYRGYYTAARRYEFYFRVVKKIFYERAQRVSKILFLTRENKIHIFKPPCNFLLLYRQIYRSPFFTDCLHRTAVKEGQMTSSIYSQVRIWKIRHSGPGCSFV